MGLRVFVVFVALAGAAAAQAPTVFEGGVVNAASFAKGQAVAPGSLVSIFGNNLTSSLQQASSIPLSTRLGDVSVSFSGVPAPLILAAPESAGNPQAQINAQVPWNVLPAGQTSGSANIVVTRGSAASSPRAVQMAPFAPGIFAVKFEKGAVVGLGVGQAIAINQDRSLAGPEGLAPGLATHPARTGDIILVLATGLGAVDSPIESGHPSADRLRRTNTMPTVLIGNREARVDFSGLTPEFPGVYQLNVAIPEGVPVGDAVPLQIRMGDITTTDQVTIAVQN